MLPLSIAIAITGRLSVANKKQIKQYHRRQKSMQNYPACKVLTISMLDKISQQATFWNIFLIVFLRKHGLYFLFKFSGLQTHTNDNSLYSFGAKFQLDICRLFFLF